MVSVPTVETSNCTGITATGATGNGNITATGGENCTRRGFCYTTGTTGDPTTANSVAYDDGSFGTGAYTKAITGLAENASYRVRAYAVNSAGTGYGTTVQLTTSASPPTVALGTNVVDTATITDTTPTFEFTGTDAQSNPVSYEIQVDTVNTFDSSANNIDYYDAEKDVISILGLNAGYDDGSAQSFNGNAGILYQV
jgi:hypothetical protein